MKARLIRDEEIEETAKKVMEIAKRHSPQLIGFDKNKKCYMVCFPMKDDEEKKLMREKMKKFISKNEIVKYILVMETWISVKKIDEVDIKNLIRPSDDIDRKEALVITEFKEGEKLTKSKIIFFYRSESNKIVWGEETKFQKGKSIWNVWGEEFA